jgi:hypothetical protein
MQFLVRDHCWDPRIIFKLTALAAWSSAIFSAREVMGREIESRQGMGVGW